MPRLHFLFALLLVLATSLPLSASAQEDADESAGTAADSATHNHTGVTAERYRAYRAYLARHADTDGDGDFDADDIEQFERSGDLSMLRDGDLMGGYFGSGDEFISDGVEHQVNGGRYLRSRHGSGMDERVNKDNRVARLDLFGMRGFLSDENTYASPGESVAGQQYSHWRNLGILLTGVMNSPADLEASAHDLGNEAESLSDQPKQLKPIYEKDDPTVWW